MSVRRQLQRRGHGKVAGDGEGEIPLVQTAQGVSRLCGSQAYPGTEEEKRPEFPSATLPLYTDTCSGRLSPSIHPAALLRQPLPVSLSPPLPSLPSSLFPGDRPAFQAPRTRWTAAAGFHGDGNREMRGTKPGEDRRGRSGSSPLPAFVPPWRQGLPVRLPSSDRRARPRLSFLSRSFFFRPALTAPTQADPSRAATTRRLLLLRPAAAPIYQASDPEPLSAAGAVREPDLVPAKWVGSKAEPRRREAKHFKDASLSGKSPRLRGKESREFPKLRALRRFISLSVPFSPAADAR